MEEDKIMESISQETSSFVQPEVDDQEENNSSTGWFDLPFEMREMIIDKMDAKTRCKFTRCSKLCEKEAKESKYYIYSIEIDMSNKEIILNYGKEESDDNSQITSFTKLDNSKTLVFYKKDEDEVLSSKSITKIENGTRIGVMQKYGKEYIEKYKNSIRKFELTVGRSNNNLKSLNLNNLNKLTSISLDYSYEDVEISQLNDLIDVNKLFQLETVEMETAKLEFENILKFEGAYATLYSKHFDEQTIVQYLTMWRDEEIHENIRKRTIYFDEEVTIERIAQSLGVHNLIYRERYNLDTQCIFACKSKNNRTLCVKMAVAEQILEVQWM